MMLDKHHKMEASSRVDHLDWDWDVKHQFKQEQIHISINHTLFCIISMSLYHPVSYTFKIVG